MTVQAVSSISELNTDNSITPSVDTFLQKLSPIEQHIVSRVSDRFNPMNIMTEISGGTFGWTTNRLDGDGNGKIDNTQFIN